MQVLESEDKRLGPRPGQNPGGHCRQLPSPQLFAARISRRGPAAAGYQRAVRAGSHVRLGRGRQTQRVFEVGEALFGWQHPRQSGARPHSAIGWSGVFCRSCEALHSTQVCGVSAELRMELLDEPRLAEAGLADDQHELAFARAGALPAARSRSRVPPRGRRRALAPARRPFGRRRWRERCDKSWTGLRHALEFVRALLLDDEEPRHLSLHVQGDEDRAGLGRSLHPRGDVRRVAEHFAAGFYDDRPGLKADAGAKAPVRPIGRSWR